MTSTWTPDPQGLQQLIHIFSGLLNPDYQTRTAANDALLKATQIEEFDNYLLHILLTDSGDVPNSTRSSAGLYLKNDLLRNWNSKHGELKAHILTMLPLGLTNSQHTIRRISSITIASVFRKIGAQNWLNIIPNIIELLDGVAGGTGQMGALEVLTLLTEESCRLLDRDISMSSTTSMRPLEELIPRLIKLLNNPQMSNEMKSQAAKCLVHCINIGSMVMQFNLDQLIETLSHQCQITGTSSDPNVKGFQVQIAKLFCSILDQWPQKLYTSWTGIIQWIVQMIQSPGNDDSEELPLQSCEFLLLMVTKNTPRELVFPIVNDILPVLLSKMVYSKEEVILMENEDLRDQFAEDKDEDIKPQMIKSKEHTVASSNTKRVDGHDSDSDDSDDSDDDDDDDDDDYDNIFTWNLRKCSAGTVDTLSCQFPIETLNIAFPIIKQNMNSNEWPIREASILTLGAISEAGLEHASHQLPDLIQFLIERVKDEQPRVRQIACWALGRYSSWVCSEAQVNGLFANYFKVTFETILNCALDNQKIVQESACSAISDFIENIDSSILNDLSELILNHFHLYFQRYHRKNLIVLYDTVQTFVERVGDQLKYQPNLVELLLPPLINKWQSLADDDKDLWALLECMSSVAAALGEAFANYALPVYERAIRILQNCIEMDKMATVQKGFDAPEKDFIVTSLDLVDGLVQGFTVHSAELIKHCDSNNKNYSLMELLLTCFDDTCDDVRQSAYALLGDLSINLIDSTIKPYLQTIMMCINNEIRNPSDSSIAARNNAIWSLGEIVIRITQQEFEPYLESMTQIVLTVVHNLQGDEDETLIENAAITLGRICVNNSTQLIQFLEVGDIIKQWLEIMSKVVENDEKSSAFIGIMMAVSQKPELVTRNVNDVQILIQTIGNYEMPGEQLGSIFYQFLTNLKSSIGNADSQWIQLLQNSGVQANINIKYGL